MFWAAFSAITSIMSAQANEFARSASAAAAMSALKNEKMWNMNVMRENADTTYDKSLLESYNTGIDPMTGSTATVLAHNDAVLRGEAVFREDQYNKQIKALREQSKMRFLGISLE